MSNKTYDFLKHLVQVVLPAIGALYAGLAVLWDLPNTAGVVGSIALICTFLGVTLGISSAHYNASDRPYDGQIVKSTLPTGKTLYSLELNEGWDHIEQRDKVVFKSVEIIPPSQLDTE